MNKHDRSSSLLGRVSVAEVSPTVWRVRGRGGMVSEAPVLLGFIQRFGNVFEAMDTTRPLERIYVSSIGSAVASITGGTVTQ